jgi:KTSC domain
MIRTPVESSSIKSVGYEADTETLEIEFCSGAIYQYAGVNQLSYDLFRAAESKGHHFAVHLRACFESHRLHDAGCRTENTCWCKRERKDVSKCQNRTESKLQEDQMSAPPVSTGKSGTSSAQVKSRSRKRGAI